MNDNEDDAKNPSATAEPFIPEIDVPKRRRSAYNLFFQHERARLLVLSEKNLSLEDHPTRNLSTLEVRDLLENNPYFTDRAKRRHRKSHGKVSFMGLVKSVSTAWKTVDTTTKAAFVELAKEDQVRYRKEWKEYKDKCRKAKRDALAKVAKKKKEEKLAKVKANVQECRAAASKKRVNENNRHKPVKKRKIELNIVPDDVGKSDAANMSRRVSLSPGCRKSKQTVREVLKAPKVSSAVSAFPPLDQSDPMPILPPPASMSTEAVSRTPQNQHDEITSVFSHPKEGGEQNQNGEDASGVAAVDAAAAAAAAAAADPVNVFAAMGDHDQESLAAEFEADFEYMQGFDSFEVV